MANLYTYLNGSNIGAQFASTAVNVNDQITIAAHGMPTGYGPIQLQADTTIPTGLAERKNYWVISIDANTIKLASSLANALAGTPIDITNVGAGTNQILDWNHPIFSLSCWRPFIWPAITSPANTGRSGHAFVYNPPGTNSFGAHDYETPVPHGVGVGTELINWVRYIGDHHPLGYAVFNNGWSFSLQNMGGMNGGASDVQVGVGFSPVVPGNYTVDRITSAPVTTQAERRVAVSGVQSASGVLRMNAYIGKAFAGDAAMSKTFNATADVNVVTDAVTITAHGKVTGYGPVQLTGTIPTGLAALTDYYIVRIDNNTVKFATTAELAFDGTPVVDITVVAVGTCTVTDNQVHLGYDAAVVGAKTELAALQSSHPLLPDPAFWFMDQEPNTATLANTYGSGPGVDNILPNSSLSLTDGWLELATAADSAADPTTYTDVRYRTVGAGGTVLIAATGSAWGDIYRTSARLDGDGVLVPVDTTVDVYHVSHQPFIRWFSHTLDRITGDIWDAVGATSQLSFAGLKWGNYNLASRTRMGGLFPRSYFGPLWEYYDHNYTTTADVQTLACYPAFAFWFDASANTVAAWRTALGIGASGSAATDAQNIAIEVHKRRIRNAALTSPTIPLTVYLSTSDYVVDLSATDPVLSAVTAHTLTSAQVIEIARYAHSQGVRNFIMFNAAGAGTSATAKADILALGQMLSVGFNSSHGLRKRVGGSRRGTGPR